MMIYLAAPWTQKDAARQAAAQIVAAGHQLTEPWWNHPEVPHYPHSSLITADEMRELNIQAWKDVCGVRKCDAMIVLQLEKSEGKAVEQGIAIVYGKPIYVVEASGIYGNLFQVVDNVHLFTSLDDVLRELAR